MIVITAVLRQLTMVALTTELLIVPRAEADSPRNTASRRQESASLAVRLTSQSAALVATASVRVRHAGGLREARFDSAGVVLLLDLRAGVVEVDVRAVGAQPRSARMVLERGANVVDFVLRDQRVELSTVSVLGDRPVPSRLQGYERRRMLGEPNGVVDRGEIERVRPIGVSVLLARLPGVRVMDSLGIKKPVSRRGSLMRGGQMMPCQMRVMLDGVLLPLDFNLDQIPPMDVHGIEVYAGAARLPPQFGSSRENSQCGVVLIWTRGG